MDKITYDTALKTLVTIHKLNKNGEKIWFAKLSDMFQDGDRGNLAVALDRLEDLGFVSSTYEKVDKFWTHVYYCEPEGEWLAEKLLMVQEDKK